MAREIPIGAKKFAAKMKRTGVSCGLVLVLLPVLPTLNCTAQAAAPSPSPASDAAWRQSVLAWRTARDREISAPDGWLTLVGLDWLKPGANSIGAAADCQIRVRAQAPAHLGLLTVSGNVVQLLAPAGGFPADLTVDGAPAREGPLTVEGDKPSTIAWHGLSMVVLERGGRYALRTKDADSPARTGFKGLHWYEPDPRFRVTAQWTPFTPPRTEKIPTVIGATLDLPSPGVAEFSIQGKPYRLQPVIEGGDEHQLFFILRDETSTTSTYGGGRFLHTALPDHGLDQPGALVIDFNQLYNPPCAYTPYATCPLPPEENRLPVPIPAGEQRYMH
ncbi:MAG: DUF1684 domain-containing protein [Terracidiphilus sp.]